MAYRGDDPTILIFGDSAAGIAAARETALNHGGRIAAALPIAEAVDRLDSQIAVDLVIVDVSIDHGPVLDRLFRRIENGALSNRFTSIVSIVPELVDVTMARIEHEDVSIMVGRDRRALADAVASRLARVQPRFQEGSSEPGPTGLPDPEDGWFKQRSSRGLPRGLADPQDGRRVFIELTEDAIDKLMAYFNTLIRGRQA